MTPYFKVTTKPAGAKTRYTIFADDVEIGSRTTARPYRFALVVTRNQPHAIRSTKSAIEFHRAEAARYAACARRDPATLAAERKSTNAFGAGRIEGYINDGSYAKWAASSLEYLAKNEADLARLESGPQPEFDQLIVASWHHTRNLVPDAKPWQVFIAIVEIA